MSYVDIKKIRTIPISARKNKIAIKDFIGIDNDMPIMQNPSLKILSNAIADASKNNKEVIFMMGAHSIKVGLSDIINDLINRGIITHLAVNGAFPIHDFEIALIGATSEYVENTIENGTFGMSEETGSMMNMAINNYCDLGFGQAIAKVIGKLKHKEKSIIYNAYKKGVEVTVHVAIGTDIIHQHPTFNPEATGKATYIDFQKFVSAVSRLEQGVIANIGSAVIMPEVFLKSITMARNLGFNIKKFTAANLDMAKHYRPTVNVVERPTSLGGKGITIIERHENSIPSLHKMVLEELK